MTTALAQAFQQFYTRTLARPVQHRGELLSVQRLRGIAVLMVLVVHVEDVARHLPGWAHVHSAYSARLGYAAADLFFVISGFIMAYITFSRPFEWRGWLVSRVLRIYPLYMLFTLLGVALWLYDPRMTMGTGPQTWPKVLASLFGVPQAGLPLLFVGWTVEHELVFYAVVFLTARVLGRERLLAVMGVLSALALLRWWGRQRWGLELWDFHVTSLYMLEFATGVLIHQQLPRLRRLDWRPVLGVGLLALLAAMALSHSGPLNEEPLVRVLGFSAAYGALLVAALNREQARRARGLDDRHRDFLVWVGDASYSIYLTHPFVLGAMGKLFPRLDALPPLGVWPLLASAGLATLLVGALTHVLLERPVMELGRRLSRPRPVGPSSKVSR